MGIKRSKVYHNLLFDLLAKPTTLTVTAFNPVKAYVNFVSRSPLNLMCLQFSHSIVSNSLWPNGLHHARLPCPSPTPRICSNSCPLSQWCHPTISSFVIPFSSCLQAFPVSGSFQMSQFFPSGGQSIGASSTSPSSEYSGLISFRIDWFDLPAVQGTLKSLPQYHSSKASILLRSAFFIVQLSHPYMTTGKTIALTRRTFVGKVVSAFQYAV